MLNATVLTDRFDRALLYATHVHGGQFRKGTSIPYVAHLLAVAATVLEYGGSEDMATAALLHDAVEDQGESRACRISEIALGIVSPISCVPAPTVSSTPLPANIRKINVHVKRHTSNI
jgi:GTP pyrophosphokinase